MKIPSYYNTEDKALYPKLYRWMQRNVGDNMQEATPWEVNTTALAEDCANNSGLVDPNVLDDETHIIWDAAADVGDWYEAKLERESEGDL